MHSAKEPEQNSDFEEVKAEVEREFATEVSSKDLVNQEPLALPDIEAEIGLKQVDLDQRVINSVAVDNTDNNLDAEDDGVMEAADEQEEVSNLSQESTESYGTGLQGQPGDRTGRYSRRGEHLLNKPDYTLTGGDVDANYERMFEKF